MKDLHIKLLTMYEQCPQCNSKSFYTVERNHLSSLAKKLLPIGLLPENTFYLFCSICDHQIAVMPVDVLKSIEVINNCRSSLKSEVEHSNGICPGSFFQLPAGMTYEPFVKAEDKKSTSNKPELVIIRGLPGSGKSTLAAEQFPDHLHYEPDHLISDTRGRYRFDDQFFGEAQRFVRHLADFALARGESVVVSDVFPKLSELEHYQSLAEAHGASMRVIDCTEQFGNCHRVPVMVMERMRLEFEPWPGDEPLPEFLKRQAD